MTCGIHLYEPMRWYLQQLQWSPPGLRHKGTTALELALDFEAATGVPLKPPGVTADRTLRQKAVLFSDAARRTAELSGGRVSPGGPDTNCTSFFLMRWPATKGWECRAHLLCPAAVKLTMAHERHDKLGLHLEGAEAFDRTRKWRSPPGTPQWSSRAPEVPGATTRKRDLRGRVLRPAQLSTI